MKETLDKLATMARALDGLSRELDATEVPSEEKATEVALRMEELKEQYRDVRVSLFSKQSLFFNVLLELAHKADPIRGYRSKPYFEDRITIGTHVLMYYNHHWTWYFEQKCESFFGTEVFNTVCETLLAKVLAFSESIPLGPLRKATLVLAGFNTELQAMLVERPS